jgi:hypothetical protein
MINLHIGCVSGKLMHNEVNDYPYNKLSLFRNMKDSYNLVRLTLRINWLLLNQKRDVILKMTMELKKELFDIAL